VQVLTLNVPKRAARGTFPLHARLADVDKERVQMGTAAYKIGPYQGGWGVTHDGSTVGPYETREAAFEATVMAASNAMREGHGVEISVPGRADDQAVAAERRQGMAR
jgi:uncharacterized protein DUF2188